MYVIVVGLTMNLIQVIGIGVPFMRRQKISLNVQKLSQEEKL
jgi:hypothetical protein